MKTVDIPSNHGVTTRLQLSSNAAEPRMRILFRGGQTLDPRDPKHLALLPVADNIEINLSQAMALRAALDEFIEILADSQDDPSYLHMNDEQIAQAIGVVRNG